MDCGMRRGPRLRRKSSRTNAEQGRLQNRQRSPWTGAGLRAGWRGATVLDSGLSEPLGSDTGEP